MWGGRNWLPRQLGRATGVLLYVVVCHVRRCFVWGSVGAGGATASSGGGCQGGACVLLVVCWVVRGCWCGNAAAALSFWLKFIVISADDRLRPPPPSLPLSIYPLPANTHTRGRGQEAERKRFADAAASAEAERKRAEAVAQVRVGACVRVRRILSCWEVVMSTGQCGGGGRQC